MHACITRKGNKQGGKLKKLSFGFPPKTASTWTEALLQLVFGSPLKQQNSRKVLFLIDKLDNKTLSKYVEPFMRPVFEAAQRNMEIKRKYLYFIKVIGKKT
jgi:hypothetical protein